MKSPIFCQLFAESPHFAHSALALERAAAEGPLIIGEVVYAELSTRMPDGEAEPRHYECVSHQDDR